MRSFVFFAALAAFGVDAQKGGKDPYQYKAGDKDPDVDPLKPIEKTPPWPSNVAVTDSDGSSRLVTVAVSAPGIVAARSTTCSDWTWVEVAPFVDFGRVFSRSSTDPLEHLHPVVGVGFRGIARPFVVGYVDIGYGSEGAAVFTGLNYPF